MPGIRRTEFADILNRLKIRPKVFVETGTWYGDTTLSALQCGLFTDVISIELDDALYKAAKCRLMNYEQPDSGFANLGLFHGDSRTVLPALPLAQECFFYLDAHWWSALGQDNGSRDVPLPLFEELRYIKSRNKREVLVVDDIQAFGGQDERTVVEEWQEVTVQGILGLMENVLYWYIDNKRLIMRTEVR